VLLCAAVLCVVVGGCAGTAPGAANFGPRFPDPGHTAVPSPTPSTPARDDRAPKAEILAVGREQGGAGIRLDVPDVSVRPAIDAATAWDAVMKQIGPPTVESSVTTTEELALFTHSSFGPVGGEPDFQSVLAWVVSFRSASGMAQSGPVGATHVPTGPCVVTIPVDATSGRVMNVWRDCEAPR
jgi:hypothetical protein